jgi:FtsH-binding integral membrane protein
MCISCLLDCRYIKENYDYYWTGFFVILVYLLFETKSERNKNKMIIVTLSVYVYSVGYKLSCRFFEIT